MNRVFSIVARSVSIAALAMSSLAHAAEPKKVTPPDAAKGEALYVNGDTARGIPACVSCHGVAGASAIVTNPKLGGQHAAYAYKQLVNFRGPERNNAIMTPYAKAMTEEEMQNVALYLDKQQAKPGAAKNKASVELGKRIYRAGIADKNVPACASCHGPNGAGMPAQFAWIGGQHQEYTNSQLVNFRTGARNNSAQMTTISQRLSDEEMLAVSDYIAGLR